MLCHLILLAPLALGSLQWPSQSFYFPKDIKAPTPYEISVDPGFIRSTTERVKSYRQTPGVSSHWTIEGPPVHDTAGLADYWTNDYDWDTVQANMNNQNHHYATAVSVDGFNFTDPIRLHFIHALSRHRDAVPLLLIHGWPSSHLEWDKVVPRLTQSFHIVAPDLPGFGFSPAPSVPGLSPRVVGAALDGLMKQLGYTSYGVVSTDLGWEIGSWMAGDFGDSIIGHMSDFFAAQPTDSDLTRIANGTASADEVAYVHALDEWQSSHAAYATVHSQKPLAVSLAFADSPVGFLGWILDLMHTISDGYDYSSEDVITTTMMLWLQPPYGNIRNYLEFNKPSSFAWPRTTVQTGVTEWGWENGPFPSLAKFPFAPREWVKRTVPLLYFHQEPFGGHFPAISHPELWSFHVRSFFALLH